MTARRCVAVVQISIDFPGAEGVWVSADHVYEGDSITDAVAGVGKHLMDRLALDAWQRCVGDAAK